MEEKENNLSKYNRYPDGKLFIDVYSTGGEQYSTIMDNFNDNAIEIEAGPQKYHQRYFVTRAATEVKLQYRSFDYIYKQQKIIIILMNFNRII